MRDSLRTNTFNSECLEREREKTIVMDLIMSNFYEFESAQ